MHTTCPSTRMHAREASREHEYQQVHAQVFVSICISVFTRVHHPGLADNINKSPRTQKLRTAAPSPGNHGSKSDRLHLEATRSHRALLDVCKLTGVTSCPRFDPGHWKPETAVSISHPRPQFRSFPVAGTKFARNRPRHSLDCHFTRDTSASCQVQLSTPLPHLLQTIRALNCPR